ncbi:L-glutaminase [Oscillatoria nigro-viridis PCC 7112]|uniref:Glutaminase n=1 Tax=Phormidium nigroviride PCC 7112 TaxID=179408 RepID=K9VDY0_9CYAN|nr:glutaminase A [Oscillatoria nigro-viridis]AFZ05677.1 L-glutaminase [Oscillatoria nigro-viridis PCC 7112]
MKISTSKLSSLQPEQLAAWAKEAMNRSKSGQIPAYIPLLARADRQGFAVQIRAIDGQIMSWGSIAQTFPLMSAVKPFVLLYLLCELGEKRVFDCVGCEPSELPFNSLTQLEIDRGKPRNPMINSGAIALASLIPGQNAVARCQNLLDWLNQQANSLLFVDELMLDSVKTNPNQNNWNLALKMVESGYVQNSEIALETYNRVCCLSGNVEDLAKLGMVLVNNGDRPMGENCRTVKALMATCGLYEASGRFALRVGLPAKSGVSGAMLSVIPGQGAIGFYSPPLDKEGNSVGGLFLLEQIAKTLRLSVFD